MSLITNKFNSSRYDIIRKSLIGAYEVYLDSEKRNVERQLRYYKIGQKITKPGYHWEDDWFTPTGRKRKTPRKVKVQNYEIIDQTWINNKRVALTKEPSKYLSFKFEIGDWTTSFGFNDWYNISDEDIDRIINRIPENYQEDLIGFEADTYPYYGKDEEFFSEIFPVFEPNANEKWIKANKDYCTEKAAWCSKYGCD